jgi:hypothetical protein
MLINVDAVMFKTPQRMGAGVVIRNHIGECLTTCSEVLYVVTTPELTEALAMRLALAITGEEGFEHVMVALDCLFKWYTTYQGFYPRSLIPGSGDSRCEEDGEFLCFLFYLSCLS